MVSTWHYIKCRFMTVLVRCENGVIKEGPPIVKKFKEQPLTNLKRWLNKVSHDFKEIELEN